ncbi:hypothetical protein CLOM_g12455 [Closterium sp. NIES-68]|nr:hypothetical protein CLOM_g12455 [Closterium sp. NIES-68]GJP70256.1 hypothetical protein CLOP_g1218 [Closterium sp. NIES-67]
MPTDREPQRGLELHLLLLACLVAPWSAAAVRLHPRDATSLALLASEWNGFNGSESWGGLRHADCTAMEGVFCDRDGFVLALMLTMKNFGVPLPTMITRFHRLETLLLIFCEVTGTIPDALSRMTQLNTLVLSGNSITGTLPGGFSRLTNLEYLYLANNLLSGPITPLSNLPQLKDLNLAQNSFNGSLPSELGNFTSLTSLFLTYNHFSGSIPSSMGNMASLKTLALHYNLLTGTIPGTLSHLHSLTRLHLTSNQLTGSIPESLGLLSALKLLMLERNLLHGSIPASLASLQQLERLALTGNQLSGSIPAVLGDMPLLQYLFLSSNSLSGSIPTALGKLTNLIGLFLSENQLCGTIPSTLSNLSKLRELLVGYNMLCGPVEPIVRAMRNLSVLYLSGNQFSGRLPSASSPRLTQFRVDGNFFSHGEVKFRNCSAVVWDTSGNCLAGSLRVCDRASIQRPAAGCASFCGVEVGAAGPECGGHGYCSVNAFTAAGECVCDPNYMLNSSNSNSCVAGAVGASLASGSASVSLQGSAYVSLQGSASVLSNGSILLTGGAPNQHGAAFASPALRLFYFPRKSSLCGIELAFTAAFSFVMSPGGQGAVGEGLAFVVAAVASDKGAIVGLGGVGRRSMGVEFDSVLSVKHRDPNDNHVGVNVGGSPVSLASATAPLILNDAQTKHAWIHYDPTSGGTLRIFLSSDPVQPLTPALTVNVSLCSALKPTASDSLFLFGFVAISSSQAQRHDILSWNFTTCV